MAKAKTSTVSGFVAIEAPAAPEPLLSAKNVNELRAIFPDSHNYFIADMLIHLRAFPDGMAVIRSLRLTDADTAMRIISARALALVHEFVSQTPNDRLPHHHYNSSAGGSV